MLVEMRRIWVGEDLGDYRTGSRTFPARWVDGWSVWNGRVRQPVGTNSIVRPVYFDQVDSEERRPVLDTGSVTDGSDLGQRR